MNWTDVYSWIYEHESDIAESTGSLISCFQLRLAQLLPLSLEENKLKLMCEKKGRDARNVSALMAKQFGRWNLSAALSHCASIHLDKKNTRSIVWVRKKQQDRERQVKGEGWFQSKSLEAWAIIGVVLPVLFRHDSWFRVDDSGRVFVFRGFESQRILICPEDRLNTSTWKLLPVWKKYAATPVRLEVRSNQRHAGLNRISKSPCVCFHVNCWHKTRRTTVSNWNYS